MISNYSDSNENNVFLNKESIFNNTTISDRMVISEDILSNISLEEQRVLITALLQEQIIEQRNKLQQWSLITGQPSQIDTGYISQHLVSLLIRVPGQIMRGKGLDLMCGSEIKSANHLDSLDKRGNVNPRWNFTFNNIESMIKFLDYNYIYLVSLDFNEFQNIRIRVWSVNVREHTTLRNRYIEWMDKLGCSKFEDKESRRTVNFQLFPPKNKTSESYARHGDGRCFDKLQIELEDNISSHLIFHAEEEDGEMKILKINI